MGREIRRVPPNWEHPTEGKYGSQGFQIQFKPLFDEDFNAASQEWWAKAKAWQEGDKSQFDTYDREHWDKLHKDHPWYWQWGGTSPKEEDYRPSCTEEQATHYQMYETVSEGTPVSPVFLTLQDLEDWLTDDGYWDVFDGCWTMSPDPANARPHFRSSRSDPGWHSEKCSRKAAKAFCESKWAPSMIMVGTPEGNLIGRGPEALVIGKG